jgi:hypothetical protein
VGKIELGLQYSYYNLHGGMLDGPGGAHVYGVYRETLLLRQQPAFTQYPAGGQVRRVP